jgi:hypothetical protein
MLTRSSLQVPTMLKLGAATTITCGLALAPR